MVSAKMVWSTMPSVIRDRLMMFGHGTERMTFVYKLIVEHIDNQWPGLHPQHKLAFMSSVALSIWVDTPWSQESCKIVTWCADKGMDIPQAVTAIAKQVLASAELREYFLSRVGGEEKLKDVQRVYALLRKMREVHPAGLSLLDFAAPASLFKGDIDWFADFAAGMSLPPLLRHMVDGLVQFAREDWKAAASNFEAALEICRIPEFLYRMGECLYRTGDSEALSLFEAAAQELPWDSTLLLRVADMREGLDRPGPYPQGKGVILLYSWNHASDLERALHHLLTADLGGAKVLLLDNGSTDETPDIARRMVDQFAGRLRTIRLPVNIGAPAARNWLLTEPETNAADWVVYLDDDALVPPDFLRHFGTALATYPQAAIVGCQISPVGSNFTAQCVDLHLLPSLPLAGDPNEAPEKFWLTGFPDDIYDFGYFRYIRPCLSVTGCCHLLRRESLDRIGGFDIIYTPSQFDDLERDLRAILDGERIIFNGHLRVYHKNRTGLSTVVNRRQAVIANANFIKLVNLLTLQKMQQLQDATYGAVFEHLFSRVIRLAGK